MYFFFLIMMMLFLLLSIDSWVPTWSGQTNKCDMWSEGTVVITLFFAYHFILTYH